MLLFALVTSCADDDSTPIDRDDDAATNGGASTRARDAGTQDASAQPFTHPPLSDEPDAQVQLVSDASANPCSKSAEQPLTNGLRIRQIALYQVVKVPLYDDGWLATRELPIVQGKQALLRVFVEPLSGYAPHPVRGVLRLDNDGSVTELVDERSITSASSESEVASTFAFRVDGALLGPNTRISVTLAELDCTSPAGMTRDARVPEEGSAALQADRIRKLRVVIVPVSVGGRVPLTSPDELAKMATELRAFYPVADVVLSVREPLSWSAPLRATDSGDWGDLLDRVTALREQDAPDDDVYYFGLVQPAATFNAYCARSCVLGLAPQTLQVQPSAQVALGASFGDAQTYETMVHELGHAHGRGHAPCVEGGSISGVDPTFPTQDGSIVSWGWDSRSDRLIPPTYKDVMGYCDPTWISSYNYGALAARSRAVNTKQSARGLFASGARRVILHADGSARWSRTSAPREVAGELEQAQVLDAAGTRIADVEVTRVALSDEGGAFLYLPTPEPGWSALVLRDRTLVFEQIAPAL